MSKDSKWALIDLKAACRSLELYIQRLRIDVESIKTAIKVLEKDETYKRW